MSETAYTKEPTRPTGGLRLPESVYKAIRHEAVEREITIGQVVTEAMAVYFKNRPAVVRKSHGRY